MERIPALHKQIFEIFFGHYHRVSNLLPTVRKEIPGVNGNTENGANLSSINGRIK